MIEYPESTKDAQELEAMRGAELIYFVIPEAALWSTVSILAILDGPIELDALKNRAMHSFLRFHRLRQRPVRKKKEFYWETVDAVDVEQHVRVLDEDAGTTQATFNDLLSKSMSTPLEIARPLWELLYAPRYEDGAAVILRIHHAYGDGRSLQAIATSILEASPEASLKRREVSGATVRHKAVADSIRVVSGRRSKQQAAGFMGRLTRGPRSYIHSMKKMAASFQKDHDTGFDEAPSAERVAAFSRPLSRALLRKASAQLQCTLNDFVLSGIAGAIRNHLTRGGKDPARTRLSVVIPVDLHSPRSLLEMKKGILTNHLGTVTMQLPIAMADGVERARIVARAMTESIESREPLMQYKSLSSFHRMPQKLLVRMFRSQAHKLSGIVSNIAGPKQPYYLAGQRMRSWLFWVSAPQLAGAHLGVSVSHYMDEIRIGLTLPTNTSYDIRQLAEDMAAETEKLMEQSLAGGVRAESE